MSKENKERKFEDKEVIYYGDNFEINNNENNYNPEYNNEDNEDNDDKEDIIDFENKIASSYSSFCEDVNDYNYFHCLDNHIINLKNINLFDFLNYMNGDE